MIQQPMDVLSRFPVRKSKLQKAIFRDHVMGYANSLGYECKTESGTFGASNVILGDPDKAKYLVTAHYDTCAGMLFPNLITPCNLGLYLLYQFAVVFGFLVIAFAVGFLGSWVFADTVIGFDLGWICYWALLLLMLFGPANKHNANDNTSGVVTLLEMARNLPEELRKDVCFVLFDLEEAGLIGSAYHRKAHKAATNNQVVLNLDCVGEGDDLVLFPYNKAKKDAKLLDGLETLRGNADGKTVSVCSKGFAMYPSDQKNFPYGVGVAAFCRTRRGTLYLAKIHTRKDTVLDEKNVKTLKNLLISYISGNHE